jgi:hypothetical protein
MLYSAVAKGLSLFSKTSLLGVGGFVVFLQDVTAKVVG